MLRLIIVVIIVVLTHSVSHASFQGITKWAEDNGIDRSKINQGMFYIDNNEMYFYAEIPADTTLASDSQKAIMAKRAALLAAYSEVAKYLEGFSLNSEDELSVLLKNSFTVKITSKRFLKKVQTVYSNYNELTDAGEVIVKINIKDYMKELYRLLDTPFNTKRVSSKDVTEVKDSVIGTVSKEYDGIVVDVSGLKFRPSLNNRLISLDGKIVYDPNMVNFDVLVMHSIAEYTTKVDKAISILKHRGVSNPLVIKAVKVSDEDTSIVLSKEDILKLEESNKLTNYLKNAKVAFVLNN